MAKRGVNKKKEKHKIKKAEKAFGKIRIHHNKPVLYTIIILFLILISLVIFIRIQEPKKTNSNQLGNECASDSDCVKQQITCCPCNMGGGEACMTRQNSSYWQERLQSCGNLNCIEMYNCQIKNCVCKEGRCQAIK